jgi:hypothetical protein
MVSEKVHTVLKTEAASACFDNPGIIAYHFDENILCMFAMPCKYLRLRDCSLDLTG